VEQDCAQIQWSLAGKFIINCMLRRIRRTCRNLRGSADPPVTLSRTGVTKLVNAGSTTIALDLGARYDAKKQIAIQPISIGSGISPCAA
jgi:hypothetical protein